MGALSNVYDPKSKLWSGCPCGQHASLAEHKAAMAAETMAETTAEMIPDTARQAGCDTADAGQGDPARGGQGTAPQSGPQAGVDADGPSWSDQDNVLANLVRSALMKGLFKTDLNRRAFLRAVGGSTAAAAIASLLPVDKAIANIVEATGPLEKTKLSVGFVPITCATPIIMAHPLGFYEKYGLDVDVIKTAGWAVSRDKSLSGEYDAAHMLTPMPLAITAGAGSAATPWTMPAVENINGQAITLAMKHLDKQDPRKWKGFTFGVPFEYSMHNFLLRYYVAEAGLDPDTDIQIRVVPPPEMVANLSAGNLDGYLSPDPFNQRAVYDGVGFIYKLTKEIWPGHPCCAFAASQTFIDENPNTFLALFKSLLEATAFSSDHANRKDIAAAISPKNYLNQPTTVVEQVLTGRFADGLGNVRNDPDRIGFDPFPYHSFAVWILTQMKRWGYIEGDVDYQGLAEQVYLATDAAAVMRDMGMTPPTDSYASYEIMGKTFDPMEPQAYVDSFAIKR